MEAAARGLIFIVCALLLVSGLFGKTFGEAERYGYLADIIRATGPPSMCGWTAPAARSPAAPGWRCARTEG